MAFQGAMSDEQKEQIREMMTEAMKKMEVAYIEGALRQRELEKQIEMFRRELCMDWIQRKPVKTMGATGAEMPVRLGESTSESTSSAATME